MQEWFLALLAVLAVLVVLYLGRRAGRLRLVAVSLQFITGLGFLLAFGAVATDYKDADGFVDCWPSCSAFQELIPLGLFVAPISFVVVTIAALFAREPKPPARGPS